MGMSMPTTTAAAPWFSSLPLSDPRCNNDSCVAFEQAHTASQAQISWLSQFDYGHYILWVYAGVVAVAVVMFGVHSVVGTGLAMGRKRKDRLNGSQAIAWDRVTALIRRISYRRLRGRLAEYVAMPSLGVAILLLVFWLAATLMTFIQRPYYRPERAFGSPPIGVRTGLMAFALVPVTIVTAGKFNLVSLVTGLGHEKLNVFHRWTAYLLLYLSVIHTLPFLLQPWWEGGYAALHEQFYSPGGMEYTGTPPLGILVGIFLFSLPPIRRRAYEVFVQLHIVFAIVFLGLCFWHAANLGDSWAYLWASVAAWLVQILVRLFGKTSVLQLRNHWFIEAPVAMTKMEENMVRLEMDVHGEWRWEPGQHVFLRFPALRALDNHPFTIARAAPRDSMKAESTPMVFYMRPHGGVTARIAKLADSGRTLSAIVDGPYGTVIRSRVDARYDSAVLVAGGGGISGVLPWLQHLSRATADDSKAIKSITLVWMVKHARCLSWVSDELELCKAKAALGTVKFEIHVTNEADTPSSDGAAYESGGDVEKASRATSLATSGSLSASTTHGRRPVLAAMLPGLIGSGRTIVLGCGPESMKVDLSNAIAGLQGKVLKGEAKEVRLHTETFGW